MAKRRGPPSQGWRTFLHNHAPDIAAMDLFVVPTIGFDLLYAYIIVRLDRRELVWINVTAHPTAEWVARQITEAFPWNEAPRHMIRDRDRIYGAVVTRRLRAMGIRDKPIAPASPWQNGLAERLIGSIRHECLDHVIIRGEAHLRRILRSYATSVSGQRCADLAAGSADRSHHFKSDPRRTSSPLHPNLGFQYTQGSQSAYTTKLSFSSQCGRSSLGTLSTDIARADAKHEKKCSNFQEDHFNTEEADFIPKTKTCTARCEQLCVFHRA